VCFLVNQAIVNDTVKKMLESGIDEPTIVATLQDIGLSEDEAKTIIQRLSAPAPKPQVSPEAQQAVNEVRQMKENILTQNEKQEAHETETYSKLSEQAEKIDSVERKIGEVHEAVRQMPLNGKDSEMPRRFTEIHTRLDEIMADTKATREIMEKVIEINRKILTELESKR
jgi:DNA repair ATPase RecN